MRHFPRRDAVLDRGAYKGKARNLRPVPLSLNRNQIVAADRDAYSAGSVVTAQVPAAL